MLKGWIERVFTKGVARDLTPEAWQGGVFPGISDVQHVYFYKDACQLGREFQVSCAYVVEAFSTSTGFSCFMQQQAAGKRPATARRPAAMMIAILAQPAGHQNRAIAAIATASKTRQKQIFITHLLVCILYTTIWKTAAICQGVTPGELLGAV